MKIICSTNMPFASEAFSTIGDTQILQERTISAADVKDADILAIRSTTKVNGDLLEGSRVKFVGTATIGINHLDTDYLDEKGITWCAAPGCNANSVSEYVTSALLSLAERHDLTIAGKTIGVIGVGNVGSRVVAKAKALGMTVLASDPPRERAEGGSFVPLDLLLEQADIVTMHVPLTRDGSDATHHMADAGFFARMKNGCIFLNSSRGAVVDTDALLAALDSGAVSHAVIDTWEGEPGFRDDLLERIDLGTPHIAGHSFEGKVMGTVMVYREACRHLGIEPEWTADAFMPPPATPEIVVAAAGRPDQQILWDIVSRIYNVEDDDRALRAGDIAQADCRATHFDGLRRNYHMRREFPSSHVSVDDTSSALATAIASLGFETG